MSHDRGCHCGREPYEYDDCTNSNCHKKNLWKDPVKMPDTQKPVTPKVFVVQLQLNRDGTPKYDLTPAQDYGELVYVLDDTASPFRLDPVWDRIDKIMEDFREGDYILPIGNPVFNSMVSVAAADQSPVLKFLVWSTREQRYIAVEADVDIHSNCI